MKNLNEILAAVIAAIEANKYSKKDDVSSFICAEFLKLDLEPAIKAVIPRVIKEWFAETGNVVENGESFLPLIPELERWQRGYYSKKAEIKALNAAGSSSSKGKSGKIDNSLFCEMLKVLMSKAPADGGFVAADQPVLQRLYDALLLNTRSIAKIIEISEAKITNAVDEGSKKAAQEEHKLRLEVIKMIEGELERLAKEAAQAQLDADLALL